MGSRGFRTANEIAQDKEAGEIEIGEGPQEDDDGGGSTDDSNTFSKSTTTVEEQKEDKKSPREKELEQQAEDFAESTSSSGGGSSPGVNNEAKVTPIDEKGNATGETETVSERELDQRFSDDKKRKEELQLVERGESKKVQQLQRARQKAQQQERKIRTSRSNKFETQKGQTVSREQAIQELETRENRLDQRIDQQRNIERGREELRELNSIIPQQRRQASTSEQFEQVRQQNDLTFDPLNRPVETAQDTINNPTEQLTVSGVEIMQRGQDFGESVGEEFSKAQRFRSDILQDQEKRFEQRTGENLDFEQRKQDENLIKGTAEGVSTVATQPIGLGVASAGAIPRASAQSTRNILDVDQENQEFIETSNRAGLAEGAAFGVQETTEQVTDNPAQFVAEEGGEEIGEAIVFGAATGGVGLAAGATPTPDIDVTPSIRAKADTGARFVTGDLGFRGTETEVRSVPASEAPLVGESPTQVRTEAEFLEQQGVSSTTERSFEPLDDGGRAQKVERIDVQGPTDEPQVTRGVRVEEPVTRTQFLKERLGLEDAKVSDFIDPDGNAIGSGPGAFLPSQETEPETDVTPETDTNTEVDIDSLFEDTEPETEISTDVNVGRPRGVIDSNVDQGQGSGLNESILPERTQDTGQDLDFEPVQEPQTKARSEPVFDSSVTPQQREPEQELEPLIDQRFDRTTERTTTPQFDEDSDEDSENSILATGNKDLDIEESIGAELIGLEGKVSEDAARNPLSFRQGF